MITNSNMIVLIIFIVFTLFIAYSIYTAPEMEEQENGTMKLIKEGKKLKDLFKCSKKKNGL